MWQRQIQLFAFSGTCWWIAAGWGSWTMIASQPSVSSLGVHLVVLGEDLPLLGRQALRVALQRVVQQLGDVVELLAARASPATRPRSPRRSSAGRACRGSPSTPPPNAVAREVQDLQPLELGRPARGSPRSAACPPRACSRPGSCGRRRSAGASGIPALHQDGAARAEGGLVDRRLDDRPAELLLGRRPACPAGRRARARAGPRAGGRRSPRAPRPRRRAPTRPRSRWPPR